MINKISEIGCLSDECVEASSIRRILHENEPLSPEKEAQEAVQRIVRKLKEAEKAVN